MNENEKRMIARKLLKVSQLVVYMMIESEGANKKSRELKKSHAAEASVLQSAAVRERGAASVPCVRN